MAFFETYKLKELDKLGFSLIIGIVYASSDEIHQCFTPGRGPLLTDIIIDTMGVFLGILLVMLILKVHKIIQDKKENRQNMAKCNN